MIHRKAGGCSGCEQKQLFQDRHVGTAPGEFQQQLECSICRAASDRQ